MHVGPKAAIRMRKCARFSKAVSRHAHDISAVNEDLAEMAAVLPLIDEYLDMSNTNMHVRAVVAKTVACGSLFSPGFRWKRAGHEAPWFEGFTGYRCRPVGDWKAPLGKRPLT